MEFCLSRVPFKGRKQSITSFVITFYQHRGPFGFSASINEIFRSCCDSVQAGRCHTGACCFMSKRGPMKLLFIYTVYKSICFATVPAKQQNPIFPLHKSQLKHLSQKQGLKERRLSPKEGQYSCWTCNIALINTINVSLDASFGKYYAYSHAKQNGISVQDVSYM